jgi:O-antigen ligase
LGFYALLLYLFLFLARMPEVFTILIGTSLYQIFILTAILVFPTLFSGSIYKCVQSRVGIFLIALHVWFLAATIFSTWKGGSVKALTEMLRYFPMAFFIGGLVRTFDELRKTFLAVMLAMMVVLVWVILFAGVEASSNRMSALGSFQNANEIAMCLTMAGPFLVYIASSKRFSMLVRLVSLGTIFVACLQVARTGSRGSLITILLLTGGSFFVVRFATKIKIAAIAVVAAGCALVIIPSTTWSRFMTLVDQQANDITGAVASSHARKALLFESIQLTLENPLFGVGPGVYAPAAAGRSEEAGQKASWQVSHNAYTQISAEAGIPALLLYLLLLAATLLTLYRARRTLLKLGREDEATMAGCLFLAVAAYCINGCFASIGTSYHFYMFAGFGIAVSLLMRQVTEPATQTAKAPLLKPAFNQLPDRGSGLGKPSTPAPAPAAKNISPPPRFGSALQRRLQQR